jgi:hypothetical protein
VVAIRELQPKRPINPTVLDGAGLKKLVPTASTRTTRPTSSPPTS